MPRFSKFRDGEFVAWDGEGWNHQGRHVYGLLQSSAGHAWESLDGLSSDETLLRLASALAENPKAIHVGFGFSYDVNMLLAHWPRAILRELWERGTTTVETIRVLYRPRKCFGVWRQSHRGGDEWRWKGGIIWDVFGFFQARFTDALRSFQVTSESEIQAIESMKAERSTFRPDQLEAIRRYNHQETILLTLLMERLRDAAVTAELTLQRWDGSGAASTALLRREATVKHLGPDPVLPSPRWPEPLRDAVQHSYFGGRIELARVGHHHGQIYQYDIRSAYPAAMTELPSLAPGAGKWEHRPGCHLEHRFSFHRVRWELPEGERFYPFPWRARDGAIYFPRRGEGWYPWPEVSAALAQWAGWLQVLEGWSWVPTDSFRPFSFIPGLFALRAQWKAQGNGAEKVLKLAINGLYGKTAQTSGGSSERAPRYHSLELAAWITSAVRAQLYRATLENPEAVIMLATDAIYSTAPLALGGDGLGSWEAETHSSGTFVQSGVYWLGEDDGEIVHSRGFDLGSLSRPAVLRAWRDGQSSLEASLTRFATMGPCVGTEKAFRKFARWITAPRQLIVLPGQGQKRYAPLRSTAVLVRSLRPTIPTQPLAAEWWDRSGISAPVKLPWRALEGVSGALAGELSRAELEAEDASL